MTLTSADFKAFVVEYFAKEHEIDLETKIDWRKWFFKPGMPENMHQLFDDSLMKDVDNLKNVWLHHAEGPGSQVVVSGGQVTYEVNLSVAPDIKDPFLVWLREHMAEMLELPGFLSSQLVSDPSFKSTEAGEAGWLGFVASYRVRDAAAMQAYLDVHAAKMRGTNPFVGKCRAWRRMLHHAPTTPTATDLASFTCSQTTLFLKDLLDNHAGKFTVPLLDEMDELYKLSDKRNSEIRFNWLCRDVAFVQGLQGLIEGIDRVTFRKLPQMAALPLR